MDELAIVRRRLRTQRLAGERFERVEDAVGWLLAVQSQAFGPAKWALGQRTRGAVEADVDAAVADGRILRTHVLRPTWHFVAPEDIRWLLALTGPRVRRMSASYMRQHGLDDATLAQAEAVFERALAGGKALTRRELRVEMEAAGIEAPAARFGFMTAHGELRAQLCSGPPRGHEQTLALLDERAPEQGRRLEGEEALAELALRYFRSHGPATLRDLCWWASLRVTEARAAVELVGDRLERFELGDTAYWHAGEGADGAVDGALLLPEYDESFVAYRDLRAVARGGDPHAVLAMRPLLEDGEEVGGWKRRAGRERLLLDVTPTAPVDEAAVGAAAERYATFAGLPLELRFA